MWILDITSLLQREIKNYFVFNPSMIPLSKTEFLLAYRVCHYSVDFDCHPWKIWDNGYKYFKNPAAVMNLKYRNELGGAFIVKLPAAADILSLEEHDSTALAILKFDGRRFTVKHNIYNPFGLERNQDARLMWTKDRGIVISYNAFEKVGGRARGTLRYRTLSISETEIAFGAESYMFPHVYNDMEKNCVFNFKTSEIIYAVDGSLDLVRATGGPRQAAAPLFIELKQYYGHKNILCSSSTPPVEWTPGRALACAHIKVLYKKIDKEPLAGFIKSIDMARIHRHGKYLYFCAFFEYDTATAAVTRVSNPFIPSTLNNHLPYLLCMPTGLCLMGDKIALTYGEGDCRAKVLVLRRDEVDTILKSKLDLNFYFMTRNFSINHLGYFGFKNTGDEAFKDVFMYLKDQYYPEATIKFYKPENMAAAPREAVNVVGGGDIINPYFMNATPANSLIAGAGIPYSTFDYLIEAARPHKVFLRNAADARRLSLDYCPDLTFILPKIFGAPPAPREKHIGISVLRTYFNPESPKNYKEYLEFLTRVIRELARDFTVWLIPFGLNERSTRENDIITCRELWEKTDRLAHIYDGADVKAVFNHVGSMEFMVAARFHSHIFSTIQGVPFISLTCGRKCIEFMEQEGMAANMFKLEASARDLPINLDAAKFLAFFREKYAARAELKTKVEKVRARHLKLAADFEQKWPALVRSLIPKHSPLVMFSPEFKKNFNDPIVDVSNFLPMEHMVTGDPLPFISIDPVKIDSKESAPMKEAPPTLVHDEPKTQPTPTAAYTPQVSAPTLPMAYTPQVSAPTLPMAYTPQVSAPTLPMAYTPQVFAPTLPTFQTSVNTSREIPTSQLNINSFPYITNIPQMSTVALPQMYSTTALPQMYSTTALPQMYSAAALPQMYSAAALYTLPQVTAAVYIPCLSSTAIQTPITYPIYSLEQHEISVSTDSINTSNLV